MAGLSKNSSDVFTNFFHKFFLVWAVEKEKKTSYLYKPGFFVRLAVETEIIINIC